MNKYNPRRRNFKKEDHFFERVEIINNVNKNINIFLSFLIYNKNLSLKKKKVIVLIL